MPTPRPFLSFFAALLLVVVLLAACLPGSLPVQSGSEPEPTPTRMLSGGDAAYGKVRYTYTIDQGDAYKMSIVQEIPFGIFLDPAEPQEPTIISGSVEGLETVTVMGLDAGVPCFVTTTFGVTFSVTGLFTPQDFCKVTLNIQGVTAAEKISQTTTCSLMPETDPVLLFITPWQGPYEMRSPYPTISEHPYSPENTVIVEMLQLVTPVEVDCTYP